MKTIGSEWIAGTALATLEPASERPPGETFKAMTAKPLETLFSLCIDLAAVEFRPRFVIADNFVGLARLGEALLCLGVGLILVRMVFLGKPAIGLFDLRLARRFFYSENGIRISHFVLSPEKARIYTIMRLPRYD